MRKWLRNGVRVILTNEPGGEIYGSHGRFERSGFLSGFCNCNGFSPVHHVASKFTETKGSAGQRNEIQRIQQLGCRMEIVVDQYKTRMLLLVKCDQVYADQLWDMAFVCKLAKGTLKLLAGSKTLQG